MANEVNQYFEAWHRWLKENESSLDSTTLGTPSTVNIYLKNRLHEAFDAGVRFGELRAKGQPVNGTG